MQVFKKDSNIFKILSEAISEGIVVMNEDKNIVATNERANQIFGYTSDEIIGLSLNNLVPKRFQNTHKSHLKDYLENSGNRQMGHGLELYGMRKCGAEFPLEVGLNPFYIYGNKFVMALVVDITTRKQAESELHHWARIFNESLNEIYIFDAQDLKFIDVNRGALKNIGYSLDELRELTPVDIKPELNKAQFLELLKPLDAPGNKKITFNTYHRRKNGSTYPVEVHLQKSSKGNKGTYVAIILDITERINYTKNLEKKVEKRTYQLQESLKREKQLNELKTKFLSLVSHEFKNPLSGILTSSLLIGKYTESGQQEKRDKHIQTIQNKVRHLNTILNDFLSVEKLENGQMNYQRQHFPISKVINEGLYDANMELKPGQSIDYPDCVDDIFIDFDEKILSLIFSNLVGNAIKYSSENATIKINIKPLKDFLKIEIKDQGIGIPETEQKLIFKRYYRASNAMTYHGTGIGLNIVKNHLENLGGSISFKSKLNHGSTFSILIPTSKKEIDS